MAGWLRCWPLMEFLVVIQIEIVYFFAEALDGYSQGDAGFGIGRGGVLDAAEFLFEGVEKLGEFEAGEVGGEQKLGSLAGGDVVLLAEEPAVVAAELLALDGDLAAEFSVGHVVLAEIGGFVEHGFSLFLAQRKRTAFGRSFFEFCCSSSILSGWWEITCIFDEGFCRLECVVCGIFWGVGIDSFKSGRGALGIQLLG